MGHALKVLFEEKRTVAQCKTVLFQCDSPDCPQSEIRYRFCGKCDKHVRVEHFRVKQRHPCAKDILFCNNKALGEHTVDHMGSILTPVDDQELTHGVRLNCSFHVCRQREHGYYFYCGRCRNPFSRNYFRLHECKKDDRSI
jgi:hypothetical protein